MIVNYKDLAKLSKAYDKAVKAKKTEFTFMGNVLLTDYAKYLVEYFDAMESDPKPWHGNR